MFSPQNGMHLRIWFSKRPQTLLPTPNWRTKMQTDQVKWRLWCPRPHFRTHPNRHSHARPNPNRHEATKCKMANSWKMYVPQQRRTHKPHQSKDTHAKHSRVCTRVRKATFFLGERLPFKNRSSVPMTAQHSAIVQRKRHLPHITRQGLALGKRARSLWWVSNTRHTQPQTTSFLLSSWSLSV